MFLRILIVPAVLLAFTLSCSSVSRPGNGNEHRKPSKRPVTSWFLTDNDIFHAFAWFHCGNQKFQLGNYRLGPGFQLNGPWWIWTIEDQAHMTIRPPLPVLKKDTVLEIPKLALAFRGKQNKFQAEFIINGETVLRQEFTPKSPTSLRLQIPARLNQTGLMTLSIRLTGVYRQSELGLKSDQRKLGIGFCFVQDDLIRDKQKLSRAVFQVEQITPPDPDGIQKARLQLLDHIYGPALPENLSLDLYPAAIDPKDPVKRYQPGDRLELILLNRPGQPPQTLYGGAVSWIPDPSFLPPRKSRTIDNPPLPEKVMKAQKEQIGKELPGIRRRVKNRTRDLAAEERFQRIWIQKQNELQLIPAVISPDNGQEIERFQNQFYWGVRHGGFFALPRKFSFMERQSVSGNISALLSFRDLLQKNQIQLIILLVPDAGQIAARALIPAFESCGSLSALQCAASLLGFGLEAVYTDDLVMSKISIAERLFCYPDPRPEAALWRILAAAAADRLSRFGKNHFTEAEDNHYAERRAPTVFGKNYRWPAGVDCGSHKDNETVESLQVFRNGVPFRPDPQSAILVIGGGNLNLPGPGHTFSGLLSKELHYSVDELVLPGKDWIVHLPLVIYREPYRYMSGKQAVILVISPDTLASSAMPDLKLLEAQKKQKPVHHFALQYRNDDTVLPVTEAGNRVPAGEIARRKAWNHSFSRTSAAGIRIRENSVPQDFLTLDIPEKLRANPMTLVLYAAAYPGQANTLTVNGHEIPLPVNLQRHHFRRIAVPLEAGTAKAVIKISGKQGNLLMIHDVTLYQ
jgi:hypothetical protein